MLKHDYSLAVLFQMERCEALLDVTIMKHVFSFNGGVSWRRMLLKGFVD
jgi:hypothetical protein